ncbi:DUF3597 domain-containing protein [Aureimonas sp. AU12]|uniref:DUF3597 domain-containing protein n=1 Tax=Aureimonas sp. AU12 TaxID=1638161 RepID=UPI000781D684|nr:DUF3597 domain-containing protein [Aureimonas sp. AU12]
MGIFDKIKGAIFGTHAEAAPVPKPAAPAPTGTTPTPAAPTPAAPVPTASTPAAPQPGAPTSAPTAAPTSAQAVDVAAMLDGAVKAKGQPLDWRKSIVDLMKALDLDSSIGARKELAAELHYTGDTSDSATMNVWLHKALMKKLAENGGKVPADLTD